MRRREIAPGKNAGLPGRNAECPCGSGRKFKRCCAQPRPSRPRGPRTGKQVKGCYLAPMSDCDGDLEREHYIPEGILRVMAGGQQYFERTFPDSPELRKVGLKSHTAHILCRRHNNGFSPLDAVAKRFFTTIQNAGHKAADWIGDPSDVSPLFNGIDIQNILLKFLCGLLSSGTSPLGIDYSDRDLPLEWLRLFYSRYWPYRWGLYFSGESVDHNLRDMTVYVPEAKAGFGVQYARFEWSANPLLLALADARSDLGHIADFQTAFWHPRWLHWTRAPKPFKIRLLW